MLHCFAIAGSLVTCTLQLANVKRTQEYAAKQYHSDCDEQHSTHRPTLTLDQVLSN